MTRTAIVYASTHHGNTRKLVEAIAETHAVTLIDALQQPSADLSGFDRIGFASGIDFGAFYSPVETFLKENLPENKDVFFLYTCARVRPGFTGTVREEARKKNARILGQFGCPGFNTYGPLKLIGGMNRRHPTPEDITRALAFFEALPGTALTEDMPRR